MEEWEGARTEEKHKKREERKNRLVEVGKVGREEVIRMKG